MSDINTYEIVCDDLKPEEIVSQLRSIKEYPAVIHLYDRFFTLSNRGEMFVLCCGVEVGYYIAQEHKEQSWLNTKTQVKS